MITIFIRTLIIYAVLIGVIRIMGKRQVGELEVSDLVTSLLLSELAITPIENHDIPIIHAVIPITALLCVEVVISMLMIKNTRIKNLFEGKPSILIKNGVLSQKELKKNRLSLDELLSELRQKDIADIADVEYAILEHNGKLSAICKESVQPPTKAELNISAPDAGLAHPVIIDGKINESELTLSGKDRSWIVSQAKAHSCKLENIFLLTVNDAGTINLIKKEK